jgi:hypothetical protein
MYRALRCNPVTGKRPLVSNPKYGFVDLPVKVPCGQCIGCRLDKSRQWAVRCVHEASLHDFNCFITLTYDDANLPDDMSLDKSHFVKFMKRLRFKFKGIKIRFFHCGEYGELLRRPHHHAILFGFDFCDKILFSQRRGVKLYISPTLSYMDSDPRRLTGMDKPLWPFGFATIGEVTFESAAYVARYVLKKITGEQAAEHYAVWDDDGTYLCQREKEYVTMSRRPGIAHDWIERYASDVYPADSVIVRKDIRCKPPRYYDGIYDLINHASYVKIKYRRNKLAAANPDNTPTRLRVREHVQLLRAAKLVRNLQ